jgi:hypothetical protein
MTANNFCFYLQNRLIQTSQTGGQWYSDTSPFSIPCLRLNGLLIGSFIVDYFFALSMVVLVKVYQHTNDFAIKTSKLPSLLEVRGSLQMSKQCINICDLKIEVNKLSLQTPLGLGVTNNCIYAFISCHL